MLNATNIVFIGLGSNLDDPEYQLKTAIKSITRHKNIIISKQSSFYQTKPYGYINQNDFLNAVIQIQTSLDCLDLLKFLQSIEYQQKRLRTVQWGPRTIDLDILCYNNLVLNTSELNIPHPGIEQRIFVLQPWVEIAPDWALPNGDRIENLYQKLTAQIRIHSGCVDAACL